MQSLLNVFFSNFNTKLSSSTKTNGNILNLFATNIVSILHYLLLTINDTLYKKIPLIYWDTSTIYVF